MRMIYRLGELLRVSTVNNRNLKYSVDLIQGVGKDGNFITPKRDTTESNLKLYKIVNDGAFVYNPTALDIGSIAYRTEGLCIVSHLYVVFYLNDKGKELLDPYYLFMYFRRSEFYRQVAFRNFGSARPEFSFRDMSEIIIDVPPIEIQRKYAGVYTAMTEHQRNLSRGLDDLRLVCDMYIEDLRRKIPCERLGDYIELSDERNESLCYGLDDVRGVSIAKTLIETVADMRDVNLKPYYILRPNEFACVPVTSRNGGKLSVALNDTDKTYICSQSYVVFRCRDENELLPEYLMINFLRSEFDRYARFNSWGSAREVFSFSDMCEIRIPIPDIKIQRSIANIYTAYQKRKSLSERLKALIKDACPVLIKGATDEAKQFAN